MPIRVCILLIALVAAPLTGACSREATGVPAGEPANDREPRPATAATFRPVLLGSGGGAQAGAQPDERVVAEFVPADDPGRWSSPVDAEGAVRLTRFARCTLDLSNTRSLAPAPDEFDLIRITARVKSAGEVAVGFLAGDELIGSAPPIPVPESSEPRAIEIAVPPSVQAAEAIDALGLEVRRKLILDIERIAFVARSATGLLPPPSGGPRLASIGVEARWSVGLVPGAPLHFEVRAQAGDRLRFAHGVPRFSSAFPPSALHVTLNDGERSRSVRLDPALEHWSEAHIDLSDFQGRTVRVELSVAEHASAASLEPSVAPPSSTRRPTDSVLSTHTGGLTTGSATRPGHRLTGCLVAEPQLLRNAPGPPSVLLVTSDTHRGDHIGAAGQLPVSTPAIDALAAEGILFENCFSTSNYTNPSHVALMTGTHPRDTGVVSNDQRLNEAPETLAERFRAAGYSTWAIVSARHLFDDISGLGQGFDRMSGPEGTERTAADAVETLTRWLAERDGRPVFVWLHVFDPHWPYEPPDELRLAYSDAAAPSSAPAAAPDKTGDPAEHIAGYRGEVTYVDRQLARVLDAEPFDGGVVALVGDHGESLGEHDTWFSHSGLFPSVLHVPLLLRYPGAPAGTRVPTRVSSHQLPRTLLELAGLRDAGSYPGQSLLRALTEDLAQDLFALHGRATAASITTRDGYHLIANLDQHWRAGHVAERDAGVALFHLETDPGCLLDLSGTDPGRTAELEGRLAHWLSSAAPSDWLDIDGPRHANLETLLETLGYAEGSDGGAPPSDPIRR